MKFPHVRHRTFRGTYFPTVKKTTRDRPAALVGAFVRLSGTYEVSIRRRADQKGIFRNDHRTRRDRTTNPAGAVALSCSGESAEQASARRTIGPQSTP